MDYGRTIPGGVGGSIEVLLGVMHPAGSGGRESPSWRPDRCYSGPHSLRRSPHMGFPDHQIGVQGNGCARLGPAVISSVQSIRSDSGRGARYRGRLQVK